MTAPAPQAVRIDRLVLDLPGLDATRAAALARGIGDGLARAGVSGGQTQISLTVPPAGEDDTRLIERIVAELLERLA